MRRIAALLTCHDRRADTLACLKSLYACRLPAKISLEPIVVDDGSTDGTSEAVRALYPDATLVEGDGRLYWNGGMRVAMQAALGGRYDFLLWLNDDVLLDQGAIATLLETHGRVTAEGAKDAIVVGSTCDAARRHVTYGGQIKTRGVRRRRLALAEPGDKPLLVATMNGNCVLLPAAVAGKLGNLDPAFTHGLGDYDYGLRATKAGVKVFVCPGYVGICERTPRPELPERIRASIRAQLAQVSNDKNLPYRAWFTYTRRHSPYLWILNWPRPYLGAVATAIFWKLKGAARRRPRLPDKHTAR